MLLLERTKVFNLEGAIRGMRNPMNSWDSSDSYSNDYVDRDHIGDFIVGPNDLKLMKKLAKSGSDHRKFMRQIFVSVDITAPLYWWKEYDTYKVGTVANSCSTMHKIHTKDLTINDFSHEHLNDGSISILESLLFHINAYREEFVRNKDKDDWWQIIQLLPSSYDQMRTCTLTYENLINIYFARRHHKLDEWHVVCDWIRSLPYLSVCIDAIEQ